MRTLGTPAPAAAAAAAGTGTGTGTGASGGTVARELRGLIKDVVLVDAETTAEVEFTADNPGATLFHCHQQNHMDLGFMMLLEYA